MNGEEAAEFILWLLPFLCLGAGVGIPILILLYETYFSNGILESTDDHSNNGDDEEKSNSEHNGS